MAKDLRHFLTELQTDYPNDFVRVTQPVDTQQEPAALLKRIEERGDSPVLLFERIGKHNMPVVVNCHNTRRRIALALGVEEAKISRVYAERLGNLITPVTISTGPVKDRVIISDEVNLHDFPFIQPSANNTAPYIGGGILLAKDPETGINNLSYNRLMQQGKKHLGFHAAPGLDLARICRTAEQRSEELPVAIVIGHHPAFSLGILAKVPFETDEYECAGAMLLESIELVDCETVPLKVPAYSEVVLEGRVLLDIRDLEGPYDEFTGYALPAEPQPVIEISCITCRHDAIWQDVFGGSQEHLLMGAIPKESSQLVRLQKEFPFVENFHMPASGGGRLHAVISLGPHELGAGKRVIESVLAIDHFLKHVFVVDDDIDIYDEKSVNWALATRFQADADLIIQHDRLGSSLDPSAPPSYHTGKLGFDCTRAREKFPPANRIDPTILKKMDPDLYIG